MQKTVRDPRHNMILVDIGNTTVHFGIEESNRIKRTFTINSIEMDRAYLNAFLKKYPHRDLLICSVAPSKISLFASLKQKCYIVGKDILVPMRCYYRKKEIGQDRLVAAFAAHTLYPDTRIVIDFGTATTIDFLSRKGEYLGGLILPGIHLYLKTLRQCELLRTCFVLEKCSRGIPRTTAQSIAQGTYYGFSAMVNGLITRYKRILAKTQREKLGVVVTGGESVLLSKMLQFPYLYDPRLTLHGLLLLKNYHPQIP